MEKPLLLLSLLILLLSGSLNAQSNVYLKINHKMGDSVFAFNQKHSNAGSSSF